MPTSAKTTGDCRPRSIRPVQKHGLFLQPAAQLLWLLCCFWSYTVVSRTFAYAGFIIVTPVSAIKLFAIVLALVALSLLLPQKLANPADYVVTGLFDISFVPFCTYWVLSNQPWWQGLLMISYWLIVLLVNRIPVHFHMRYIKGAQSTMYLVAGGLVLVGVILIVAGGHLTLRLSLNDVYSVRTVWAAEGSWLSTYLFPWLAHILLPVLSVHAWKTKRPGNLTLLVFIAYLLFTSTGMKTYLFVPAVTAIVFIVATWRPRGSIVPVGLSIFAGFMILLDTVTGSGNWSSMGLRRVMFVPAHLTSVYMDFFSVNPVIRLSDSLLLRGWSRYPYSVSVPRLIGTLLGDPTMNANTGLAADGFSNFGILGALAWAVLLGILMRVLRQATERRESHPEAWAVAAMWPLVLIDSALTTSLLTHGLALGLLVVWSLRPEAKLSGAEDGGQAAGCSSGTGNRKELVQG